MREIRSQGSVRGVPGNQHSYRDKNPAVDLTPRIRPYITQEGLTINSVTLPIGLHTFRVSINDARGRLSEKDFTILVSGVF